VEGRRGEIEGEGGREGRDDGGGESADDLEILKERMHEIDLVTHHFLHSLHTHRYIHMDHIGGCDEARTRLTLFRCLVQ